MSGFDSGTVQNGVHAQARMFGAVVRGYGPPVPAFGAVGDVYMDVQTRFLYQKRAYSQIDPWGHYLYEVPEPYADTLKWFSTFAPSNDFGMPGDYCLQLGGWANYGLEISLYGPKAAYGWFELGSGPDTVIDPLYQKTALPVGLSDEGDAVAYSTSTQIIVGGLIDEYILAIPTLLDGGTTVPQLGLLSGPVQVSVPLNPLYSATDVHTV